MINQVLLYAAAFMILAWGTAHLFATRAVVKDFGAITKDNTHIITMEWIVEAVCLFFIGTLVAIVTASNSGSLVSRIVYWTSIAELNVLSCVSLFTGFRVSFLPFKLCPVIFTGSSFLILLGILV